MVTSVITALMVAKGHW